MPVPANISELSQTPASNSPVGTVDVPSSIDDYQRTHAAFIATLRDGKGFTSSSALASGATTDIGAQNALFVDISGATTITSFGTNFNGPRFLRFASALTLTHNATTLVLPGGVNIAVAAGDTLLVIPKTTAAVVDGWIVIAYQRNSGVGVAASELQNQTFIAFTTGGTSTAYTLTPTPAITAYTAGQSFFVTFNAASGAAPTLAISAVATPPNLVKQNGDGTFSNIAAGDIPINHRSRVTLLSATQAWVETLPARRIGQIQTTSTGAVATGTTTIPHDDTIPQITEGDQYLSLSFTPINANSLLEISVEINVSHSVANVWQCVALFDGNANALNAKEHFEANGGNIDPMIINHTVSAASTSARTYSVRAGSATAGTTTVNGASGARSLGGVLISNMIIKEYLP